MMTLLIVDDNREMRQLMKSIVSEVCDEIFECEDGDEVLPAFNAHRPDWVLMDVEMKRVDGLRATSDLMNRYPEASHHRHETCRHRDALAAKEAGALFLSGQRKTYCHCCR
jgi:CheY-like chemotaxis protein